MSKCNFYFETEGVLANIILDILNLKHFWSLIWASYTLRYLKIVQRDYRLWFDFLVGSDSLLSCKAIILDTHTKQLEKRMMKFSHHPV